MKIERVMTREVVSVRPSLPLKDAAKLMTEKHISGMPVCDASGAVVGVISEADILRYEQGIDPHVGGRMRRRFRRLDDLDKLQASTVGEAMTAPALTIRPTDQVAAAARTMIARRINRLPVVWKGALVGIVSRADLVRAFHRSDEELAVEIRNDVFRNQHWLDPESLGLQVEDGVVKVWGPVENALAVQTILHGIMGVPGVVHVRSQLHSRAGDDRHHG
jgi:CBS domain-containing protein